jgi:hypothetical protein
MIPSDDGISEFRNSESECIFPCIESKQFVLYNLKFLRRKKMFQSTDRSKYQQIPIQDDGLNLEENERIEASTNSSPSPPISGLKLRSLHLAIFFMTFSFYSICVFHTFAPHWYLNPSSIYDVPVHRFLQGEDQQQQSSSSSSPSSSSSCTAEGVSTSVVVGGIAGVVLVGGAFLVIGLTPIGPIAGGLFAANMGSGLVAGGLMATIQSAAMTGTAYATGAGLGAAAGVDHSCGR